MSVEIEPVSQIIQDLDIEPNGAIHKYFTFKCKDYMDKYVPKRDKTLRNSARVEGANMITYSTPYVYYQYYGEREDGSHKVQHYTTPGTRHHWDELMIANDMDDILDEVAQVIGRDIRK